MSAADEITHILQAIGRGESRAAGDLLSLVYEELRRLAAARMARESAGQTLQPTALVHEVWLRLAQGGEHHWQSRAHFFGAAAEAMRRILIENARRKARLRHGGGQERLAVEDLDLPQRLPDDNVLLINEALEHLEEVDAGLARVVVLKFFGGLTAQEIAVNLQVSVRTAERQWAYARAWLYRYIRAQR